MAKRIVTWIAVIDGAEASALLREGLKRLTLDPVLSPRPAVGDRIAVLAVRGPLFVAGAAFVATADVRGAQDGRLTLRHRVLAPQGHTIPLTALPVLRTSAGWTHVILGGLRGSFVETALRDYERIEVALLEAARAYGPPAKRPRHRRPRTPGRRALIAGRAAVGRRPG